jgi:hypothetical protein
LVQQAKTLRANAKEKAKFALMNRQMAPSIVLPKLCLIHAIFVREQLIALVEKKLLLKHAPIGGCARAKISSDKLFVHD